MLNINSLNTSLLNQLKSEILVFDKPKTDCDPKND